MKRILLVLPLFMAACAGTPNKSSRDTAVAVNTSTAPASADESAFLQTAAEGSMTEMALGRFASGHATDQRLKDYGYRMMEDHGRLLATLRRLAAQRQVALPDTVNDAHMQLLRSLGPEGGNWFDSTYMAEVIAHQKVMVNAYDEVAQASGDDAFQSFTRETTPALMRDLLQIITIKDSINIRKPR